MSNPNSEDQPELEKKYCWRMLRSSIWLVDKYFGEIMLKNPPRCTLKFNLIKWLNSHYFRKCRTKVSKRQWKLQWWNCNLPHIEFLSRKEYPAAEKDSKAKKWKRRNDEWSYNITISFWQKRFLRNSSSFSKRSVVTLLRFVLAKLFILTSF